MSTWSENFVPLKDSYKIELPDRTIRSSMDVGPAKVRKRTILGVKTLSFSMLLSDEVFEEFEQFYIDNDASVFDFKRPDNKKMVQARFKSVPSANYNETMWAVNVTLEILP